MAALAAVVTPVYNGAEYLEQTMACVQAQSYRPLLHVVVDNASTDDTPNIIRRFANGRVPVRTSRNRETLPVGKNWSLAASLVPREAKYFQILCADDLLRPDAVEKMVAVAESDPAVELVGSLQRRGTRLKKSALRTERSTFDGAEVARAFLQKRSDDIPHAFGLFRRHESDFEGDFFDLPNLCLDTDACLRALCRGKFGFVHEPLHEFRLHEAQLSRAALWIGRRNVWEPLTLIDRWARHVMPADEAADCFNRHLRVVYRYMLAWRLTGKSEVLARYRALLAERGIRPGFGDYARSVLEWPLIKLLKYQRPVDADRRVTPAA